MQNVSKEQKDAWSIQGGLMKSSRQPQRFLGPQLVSEAIESPT